MPPLSEKVKVLNLIREKKKKNLYAEVTTIYSKNKSSISEIVQKEKGVHADCFCTSNCKSHGLGKCLVKVEKALHQYNKIF